MTLPLKNYQLDWYSYTLPLETDLPADRDSQRDVIASLISQERWGGVPLLSLLKQTDSWDAMPARRPYRGGERSPELGIALWWGGQGHVLIEIQGRGCKLLSAQNALLPLIAATHTRATRVDVALDYETTMSPTSFVGMGYSNRIKSTGTFESTSGSTVYLGSRTSSKYARIYRYTEPSPRAGELRSEYVFRKRAAKHIARSIADSGVISGTYAYVCSFGTYVPELDDIAVSEPTKELRVRESAKTERWLITQCAPAFRRLVQEGVITDPLAFLTEHFLSVEEAFKPDAD